MADRLTVPQADHSQAIRKGLVIAALVIAPWLVITAIICVVVEWW
jgi:hypothetical protein